MLHELNLVAACALPRPRVQPILHFQRQRQLQRVLLQLYRPAYPMIKKALYQQHIPQLLASFHHNLRLPLNFRQPHLWLILRDLLLRWVLHQRIHSKWPQCCQIWPQHRHYQPLRHPQIWLRPSSHSLPLLHLLPVQGKCQTSSRLTSCRPSPRTTGTVAETVAAEISACRA